MRLACTTSKAALPDLYIVNYNNTHIYASTSEIRLFVYGSNNYIGTKSSSTPLFEIVYSEDIQDWVTSKIFTNSQAGAKIKGTSTPTYTINYATTASSTSTIATNCEWTSAEKNYFKSFTNSLNLPSGLTEDRVNDLIDSAINNTTSASTTAKNIQTTVTNNYIEYSNGNITLSELQATIDDLKNQLDNLNALSSTTLADKVAITNATLQVQLVQDAANKDEIIEELKTDLKVSSSVSTAITGKINEANQTFQNYSQGSVTQTQAVTQINQYITYLTSQITSETPTADIEAINTAINTINGIKDSITSHSDLDNNVSDEAQRSDQEEKEYLEDITAETTENINTLKAKVDSSISESQANEVKEQVITPLLQNTLIVKVLPIAALFMVLAVTLGFKYKL